MNKYESVIIVNPTINKEKEKEIENKYSKLMNKNGKLESFENLGTKKLAYEIQKHKEGIYMQFYFKSKSEFIAELERQYRIDDDVIKFITIRVED